MSYNVKKYNEKSYNKSKEYKPTNSMLLICAALALAAALVPLLRLAMYSVPWYDDFNYGMFTKNMIDMNPGILSALKGAYECARTQWYAWQGTFSSIFFMALMPAVWGEQYYFTGPVFLILLFAASVVILMYQVLMCFGSEKKSALTISFLGAVVCLNFIHSSQAGYYWYNAGVHYVGMHSFCMLMAAALIRLAYVQKKAGAVILSAIGMLFALLSGGSNYVTALQGLLILLFISGAAIYIKKGNCLRYVPILIVYIAAFYRNVTAPGNNVRSASYEGWGYSFIEAIGRSFLEAFGHIGEFTGPSVAAVLILFLPIMFMAVQNSNFKFTYPAAVLFFSFCLYATGFTPSLYSMGNAGLSRTLNAVKTTYLLLLMLNEFYIVGWLKSKVSFDVSWVYYLIVLVIIFITFLIAPNKAGCYASYGAYYYVKTGEAYNFYHEYLDRVDILKSDETYIVFAPYVYKPWCICMGDLSDDADAEENKALAAWYDKDTVVVK